MLKAPSISIITTKEDGVVVASDADVIKAAEGVDPDNTSRVNAWGLRNFDKWMMETGKATSSEPVPEDLLHYNDPVIVSKWLCKFILETRQESGKPYPPKSFCVVCIVCQVLLLLPSVPVNLSDLFSGQLQNCVEFLSQAVCLI